MCIRDSFSSFFPRPLASNYASEKLCHQGQDSEQFMVGSIVGGLAFGEGSSPSYTNTSPTGWRYPSNLSYSVSLTFSNHDCYAVTFSNHDCYLVSVPPRHAQRNTSFLGVHVCTHTHTSKMANVTQMGTWWSARGCGSLSSV